jgi:hypothetical protein
MRGGTLATIKHPRIMHLRTRQRDRPTTPADARGNGGSMAGKAKVITLDAWNACAVQADMARLLEVEGKGFREVTRKTFGVYVNRGDVLDARLRAYLFAYHVTLKGNADARIVCAKAYKAGDTFDAFTASLAQAS